MCIRDSTQSPRGFAALVVAFLVALLLGSLLSGCLRVETDLNVVGPGRVRLQHRLRPLAETPLPFQRSFSAALENQDPPYRVTRQGNTTILSSPLLTPSIALTSLHSTWVQASALGGFALPPPTLEWQETNWLLGVSEHIQIRLDLGNLPSLPGLDLNLRLTPFPRRAFRVAQPSPMRPSEDPRRWVWHLEPGQVNHLEIRSWRWNPIGLGGVLISLALLLVVLLQRMRVHLGLGLPELPA